MVEGPRVGVEAMLGSVIVMINDPAGPRWVPMLCGCTCARSVCWRWPVDTPGELVVEVESTVRRPHLSRRDRAAAGAIRRQTRREAQGSSPWGHD